MTKRKFLICFPYEGDVKKIDKIADALESEGVDFMQVDGETPSGEFVSIAKGDIDEVKEDIAEIPGFEGTMAGLDDLTIMPKDEDEDGYADNDFVKELKKIDDATGEKVLVNFEGVWIPGEWNGRYSGGFSVIIYSQDLDELRQVLYDKYGAEAESEDIKDEGVNEWLDQQIDFDGEKGIVLIPEDFTTGQHKKSF